MSTMVTTMAEACSESYMTHGSTHSGNEANASSSVGPSYCDESQSPSHVDAALSCDLISPAADAANASANQSTSPPSQFAARVNGTQTTPATHNERPHPRGELPVSSTHHLNNNSSSNNNNDNDNDSIHTLVDLSLRLSGRAPSVCVSHSRVPAAAGTVLSSDELLKHCLTTTQRLLLPHTWATSTVGGGGGNVRRGSASVSASSVSVVARPPMFGAGAADQSARASNSSFASVSVDNYRATAAASTATAPWIVTSPTHQLSTALLPVLRLPRYASLLPLSAFHSSFSPASLSVDVRTVMVEFTRRRAMEARLRLLPRHHQMQSLMLQECGQRELTQLAEASMRAKLQSRMAEEQWTMQERFVARVWKTRQEELRTVQQTELMDNKTVVSTHTRRTEQEIKSALSALQLLQPRCTTAAMASLQRVWGLLSVERKQQQQQEEEEEKENGAAVLVALMEEERMLRRTLVMSVTRPSTTRGLVVTHTHTRATHASSYMGANGISSSLSVSLGHAEEPYTAEQTREQGEDESVALARRTALSRQQVWFRHCVVASFNAAALLASASVRATIHEGPKGFALAASRAGLPNVKVVAVMGNEAGLNSTSSSLALPPSAATTTTTTRRHTSHSTASLEVLAWVYVVPGGLEGGVVQAEALAKVWASMATSPSGTCAAAAGLRPEQYQGILWPKDVLAELTRVHKQQQQRSSAAAASLSRRGATMNDEAAVEEGGVVGVSEMTLSDVLEQSVTTLSYNGIASAELFTRDVDTVGNMSMATS